MTIRFRINGLHCESCVKFCTLKFKKFPGVTSVTIALTTGEASVEAEGPVPLEGLQEALAGTEYIIEPSSASGSEAVAT